MAPRSVPVLAALIAATLSLAAAPVSSVVGEDGSARIVLRDGARDVWEENPRSGRFTRLGAFPTADVRRARGWHRRGAIVVRTRYADLQRQGRQHTHAVFVDTPDNLYLALVMADPRRWPGRHGLEQWGPPRHGSLIPCENQRHRINYRRDLVTVRVPRSCLGDPAWVRVRMHNEYWIGGFRDPVLFDNPHNRRVRPAYTRRLPRG